MKKRITHCHECGSDDLEWLSKPHTNAPVQDGRLKLNEIFTIYFLACHCCSATVQFMNEDQALTLVNEAYFK